MNSGPRNVRSARQCSLDKAFIGRRSKMVVALQNPSGISMVLHVSRGEAAAHIGQCAEHSAVRRRQNCPMVLRPGLLMCAAPRPLLTNRGGGGQMRRAPTHVLARGIALGLPHMGGGQPQEAPTHQTTRTTKGKIQKKNFFRRLWRLEYPGTWDKGHPPVTYPLPPGEGGGVPAEGGTQLFQKGGTIIISTATVSV